MGLLAVWERELSRWAPELGLAVITPPATIRDDAWRALHGRRHVLLTNYEQLRSPPPTLLERSPDLIVADEAHRARRRSSLVGAGLSRLRSQRTWALTGTPIERDREDAATLLALVAPRQFSPRDGDLHASVLYSRAREFVLRRRKSDVLAELPHVVDVTERLPLSVEQIQAYRAAVRAHRAAGPAANALALLGKLLALCDVDPDSGASSKLDRVEEIVRGVRERAEKVVIFSHRIDPLRRLHVRFSAAWGPDTAPLLTGEMKADQRNSVISTFRFGVEPVVLLASSRVAGEGLTLVEANHVVLLNQWWNPSANDQARDRVVRIGQSRNVRVYRFCCVDTVEEVVEQVLKDKRQLMTDIVDRLGEAEAKGWQSVLDVMGTNVLERNLPG